MKIIKLKQLKISAKIAEGTASQFDLSASKSVTYWDFRDGSEEVNSGIKKKVSYYFFFTHKASGEIDPETDVTVYLEPRYVNDEMALMAILKAELFYIEFLEMYSAQDIFLSFDSVRHIVCTSAKHATEIFIRYPWSVRNLRNAYPCLLASETYDTYGFGDFNDSLDNLIKKATENLATFTELKKQLDDNEKTSPLQ